jgi:preprotein translocase subunit SecA
MGQRDPLVEYQREGFDMFSSMMEAIKEESVGFLFNVEVQLVEEPTGEVDVEPAAPPAPINVQDWVGDAENGEAQAAQAVQAAAEAPGTPAPRPSLAKGFEGGSRPQALTYTAPTVDGDSAVVSSKGGTDLGDGVIDATGGKPGRNDP